MVCSCMTFHCFIMNPAAHHPRQAIIRNTVPTPSRLIGSPFFLYVASTATVYDAQHPDTQVMSDMSTMIILRVVTVSPYLNVIITPANHHQSIATHAEPVPHQSLLSSTCLAPRISPIRKRIKDIPIMR